MKISGELLGTRKKRFLTAARFMAITAVALLILPSAEQSRAESQTQNTTAAASTYEYEAVTIKPSKGPGPASKIGMWPAPDGFNAWFVTPQQMVSTAYGVERTRVLGGPDWFPSERFDIEAKMDASVADALQKLSSDESTLARRQMLQTVLADRFKLAVHRETKELPVYTLVIAKNGPKLQTAKPGDTYANAPKFPDGTSAGAGVIRPGPEGGIIAQAIPITSLLRYLVQELGHPVVDKTGLSSTYDFTLQFTPDDRLQAPPGSAPNQRPQASPSDFGGPSLFNALQEQLGLRLEAGKGPVEIIVVDHVERPSGN
jgi:uncharacterized protein (TIGR03435 family)